MFFRAALHRFHMLLRSNLFLFSAVWIFGMITGICLVDAYDFNADIVGSSLITVRPLPIATLLITTLPVLIVGLSLLRGNPVACFVAVALVAVCRGFCGFVIFLSFGSAAWLIRVLLLFSGTCASVLMWWLMLRSTDSNHHRIKKHIIICVLSAFFVSAVDILVISPFLCELAMYI